MERPTSLIRGVEAKVHLLVDRIVQERLDEETRRNQTKHHYFTRGCDTATLVDDKAVTDNQGSRQRDDRERFLQQARMIRDMYPRR